MQSFTYKAIDHSGKTLRGALEAADQASALERISQMGLTPIQLKAGHDDGPWWSRDIKLFGGSAFKSAEIETFFQTLATMTAARIPLPRVLQLTSSLARTTAFRKHLERAGEKLQNGQTLADALQDTNTGFPPRLLRIIALGEQANALPDTAARLAEMLQRERQLRAEVNQALVYPTILLIMSLLVGSILVFYLTPTLLPVFTSSGAAPPVVIAAMDWLRRGLINYWPIIVLCAAGIVVAGIALRQPLSSGLTKILPRVPGIGSYLKDRDMLAFCRALELMLASGAQLPDAVKAAREAVTLPAWKSLCATLHKDITAGGTINATLAASPLPDVSSVALLRAGEEGNRIAGVLPTVCKTLEARTRSSLNSKVKLLTPLLTLIIGVTIGGVILSTIGAILDLNDVVY